MNNETPLDLDAIERRANAATPGPWDCYSDDENTYAVQESDDGDMICEAMESLKNANFIAHARTDVPALIAEVRNLRAKLAHLRALLDLHDAMRGNNDHENDGA
jgi:hypothetical protein